MIKRQKFDFPQAYVYLGFIFILCIVIAYFDRFISLIGLVFLAYFIFYNYQLVKNKNEDFLLILKDLSIDMNEYTKQTMLDFPVPFLIMDEDGTIQWHNSTMAQLTNENNLIEKNLQDFFEKFELKIKLKDILPKEKEDVYMSENFSIEDNHYYIKTININKNPLNPSKYVVYFFDTTKEEKLHQDIRNIKPVILYIQVDNFDEVMDSTSQEFKPLLEADIERHIRSWAEKKEALIARLSRDRYLCIFSEPMLSVAEQEKFNLLDDMREIEFSNMMPVTISIGVSTYEHSLIETSKIAFSSLDMALGRGGDQAVCKIYDKTFFYGGRSKTVEKKNRVRARMIAHSLRDLIKKSSNVLVMGHKYPDLDALGSGMGIVGISKMLSTKANIVMASSNKSIDTLYEKIISIDAYKNVFVSPEHAHRYINPDTLLVIVDTHRLSLTEMPELVDKIKNVVMIDHHRRGLEFLDTTILSYHETYASSASELITELIQYVKDGSRIDTITAESLLSGITLDTKNFVFKTGVRTFEAAAFLRKNGADPLEIKKFFKGDYESFMIRNSCSQNVKIVNKLIAIASYDKKLKNPALIASQIADELLNIQGIEASFVIIESIDKFVQVSARSLEKVNVQVIMEKLGGGGHIDTAATQIRKKSLNEVIQMVEETAVNYIKEEEI